MYSKKLHLYIIFFASLSFLQGQTQIDYLEEKILLEQAFFIENDEARKNYMRIIESTDVANFNFESIIIEQINNNSIVNLYQWRESSSVSIIFANETNLVGVDRFKIHGKGNYVFKKRLTTGSIDYLRIFIQDDGFSYIQIRPDGLHRSSMDIYINSTPVYRNIKIPMSFTSVAISPLARMMATTKNMVNWAWILPHKGWDDWQKIKYISLKIDPYLSYLRENDEDDGAQDQDGRFIFIATGKLQNQDQPFNGGFNCSGFSKWIADALYAPLNNSQLMDPQVIKKAPKVRKTDSINNNYPERDPYFGLDWVRNIAYEVASSQYPYRKIDYDSMDVNDTPFFSYIPDVGYSLNNLEAILYLQAIRYPNSFYIGSINKEFGSNPSLRQHLHTAVFFPYFDQDGTFYIRIYDRNKVNNPDRLRQRYLGGYVHLERIEAIGDFILPAVN